ncbi:MAG: capsid cement protein [Selenomonadaceae bacterium]
MVTATHIQKGDIIDFTATTDVAYLEVVPLANKIGIALEPIATGATGSLSLTEVWELPAAAPLEIAAGDTVYWNKTNNNIDKTNSGVSAGFAIAAKTAAATTVRVKIG